MKSPPEPWPHEACGLRGASGRCLRRDQAIFLDRSHIASTSRSTSFASCHRWVETRTAGIGVQFADTTEGEAIKNRIETMLAGSLNGEKPTHTM